MTQEPVPPAWRRLPGVAPGTWQYVHQRAIARHYDQFVADTPLCRLDRQYVLSHLASKTDRRVSSDRDDQTGRVLDLGCGTGRLSNAVADLGFDVLAVDLSQTMLEQMSEQTPNGTANDIGTICAIRANLVQLDALADDIADHAICMFSTLGMIQGTENRRRFLRHVARVVRSGGTFILHVHRRWAALRERGGWRYLLRSRIDSLRKADVEFGDATYAYRGLADMFMHRFSLAELHRDLRVSGWQVDQVDRVNLTGEELSDSTWNSSGFFLVCRSGTSIVAGPARVQTAPD